MRREKGHDAPVAALLRDMVRTGRFDHVVLGAGAVPQARPASHGGVSRDMMRFSPVPLFLAH